MQSAFCRLILVLVLAIWLIPKGSSLYCQQVILNTRGERIVVYPDGSWRYYERADSTLLSKNLVKEDVLLPGEKTRSIYDKPTTSPSEDQELSELATRFAERIAVEVADAKKELASTVEDKFQVEGRLSQAQENQKLIEADIISALEDEYDAKTVAVKMARKHVQWLEKMYASAESLLDMPVKKKSKALDKLIVEYDKYHSNQDTPDVAEAQPVVRSTPPAKTAPVVEPKQEKTSRTESASRKEEPVVSGRAVSKPVYVRAPVPCQLASAPDPRYPRSAVAVERELLFTHTDEELRPYFRQKELVTCYAGLIRVEDRLYLSLEFQIASSDARKNFGVLETNSMLRLKLINGEFINLFNTREDVGKIDAYTGNTIYNGNYLIDRIAEKALSTNELDKLRVVWSSGFEDYDVVNLDFLINQFSCIRSHEEQPK